MGKNGSGIVTCVCVTEALNSAPKKNCDTDCKPGDTWQKDCNTCICTAESQTVCTEKSCLNSCIPDSGPGAGQPCIFPFTWNKVTYSSCAPWIWTGSNFGRTWCSTKVDRFGDHIDGRGNYGFCSEKCSKRDETRTDYFPVSLESDLRDAILFPAPDQH